MTKRKGGRRVKVDSSWNRRLKVERTERAAERAERNEWSKTAPGLRARGGASAYREPGEAWTPERDGDDAAQG